MSSTSKRRETKAATKAAYGERTHGRTANHPVAIRRWIASHRIEVAVDLPKYKASPIPKSAITCPLSHQGRGFDAQNGLHDAGGPAAPVLRANISGIVAKNWALW